MKQGYMIQDYTGNFWDEDEKRVRGVVFATFYTDKQAATDEIERILAMDEHKKLPFILVDAFKN